MTDSKPVSPPDPLKPSNENPDADSEASQVSRVRETPPALSPSEGKLLNGVSNTESPTRPVSGGVGRRTSILFRKAKNGAKLHRDKDNQLQNGESRTQQHPTPPTTTATPLPLTTEATVPTPANRSACSRSASPDQQREKTPPRSVETGITANFCND